MAILDLKVGSLFCLTFTIMIANEDKILCVTFSHSDEELIHKDFMHYLVAEPAVLYRLWLHPIVMLYRIIVTVTVIAIQESLVLGSPD